MLGILKRKQPEKEKNKEILHTVLNHEENIPELPTEKHIKAPEIPIRPPAAAENELEPPFTSWNDNISDEEIPMPPPIMENKTPEPIQEVPVPPPIMSHPPGEKPVQNNPMLPPIMEHRTPKRPVQAPVETKPFRSPSSIKGPVFLSLGKYQEVKSMLSDLKQSSVELRNIIAELKKNRDGGTSLLEQSVERLSTIENRLEEISATLRAG
ncbi:MAG: hypothetical protein KAJ91_04365 [Candidatus Aenigmarchaeota archaeon]|nr:hypothetical protein [Candidatus Aenigmarchaeota archaeon]